MLGRMRALLWQLSSARKAAQNTAPAPRTCMPRCAVLGAAVLELQRRRGAYQLDDC
jgi:hypothetical protein